MSGVIEHVFLFLVFPGLLFSAALGLFLVWIDRKVTAMVQWRVGPPPTQPYWDVVKLLGKETVLPAQGWKSGFVGLTYVALSAAALAGTLVWIGAFRMDTLVVGDLLVILYLLSIPGLAVVLGGTCSGNPLGAIGASREMKLILAYELPFVLAILVAVFQKRTVDGELVSASTLSLQGLVDFQVNAGCFMERLSGILAFVVALLCCQAKLGFVPFDVAEAECEIGEGAHIEYSGAPLGLLKLTQAVLLACLPALLVTVFWGGMDPTLPGVAVFACKFLLILVILVLIKNTNPRVRIDQALRFFWGPVTILALASLILAVVGL